MAQDPNAAAQGDNNNSEQNRADLLDLNWDDLPFRDISERIKAQEFAKYLSDARGLESKSLKPFEMATFYLGNENNNEMAGKQYISFLKFSNDFKFHTVSKESLLKSMTMLKQAYALGGTITSKTDKTDKNEIKYRIFSSQAKHIFPSKFDSVYSMIKALYYIWNEYNFYTNFDLSRGKVILFSDLSGLGMKNFSITAQRAAVTMMQYIYPITLDTIYLCDAPFMMHAVIGIVTKLIDTKNVKLKQMTKKDAFAAIGDDTQIPSKVGGKYEFKIEKTDKKDEKDKTNENNDANDTKQDG